MDNSRIIIYYEFIFLLQEKLSMPTDTFAYMLNLL